ncbi:hypothetical protein MKK84_24320 [Methylobacterium sp. E-065]|uniref:hypothetical protein n=1 Tax=Methylobacterium sp. E-065 TaxID=2836583 RepID=UPI001FB976B4|nr:hypothetical protein [Methylobacterium sp. E-065]MCJ2020517.1 hypothetical protein [Methylobacterium sp. E-065]
MDSSANKINLPSVLTDIMQPWIDVVEIAAAGMGLNVMKVAAEVVMSLQRLIVVTQDLENLIAEARLASDNLGISLNQDGTDHSKPRIEAMQGLDALIMQLREAKLNDQAKGLA